MNTKNLAVYAACLVVALGTERMLVRAQAPGAQARQKAQPKSKTGNNEYLHGPSKKELIYVTLPGTLEASPDANGNGIGSSTRATTTISLNGFRRGMFPPAGIPSR